MRVDGDLLTFPFRDPEWQKRFLIGSAIGLGAIIFFPVIFLITGYQLRAMRNTIHGGDPALPDWDDVGSLLIDGLKMFLVSFVYLLPVFILVIGMYVLMLALGFGVFGLVAALAEDPTVIAVGLPFAFPLFIAAFVLVGGLTTILSLFLVFMSMVAVTRMLAHDDLSAAFDFREVWGLLRQGFKYYLIAFVVQYGLGLAIGVLLQFLSLTIILICLMPFLTGVVQMYVGLMSGTLFGMAYHQTQTNPVGTNAAPAPSEPASV
ncbi:MAG: DUF4013 domain-containing protein [Chloroflexi bacterium]|nr:DUF4013 domain-containing protein [Chloroflexota bacterium]